MFKNLRKLYGRTKNGTRNRVERKITLQQETIDLMSSVTDIGNGKNGSALIELSVRVLVSLVGNGENIEYIATELKTATDSPNLSRNLNILSRYIDAG